MSTKNELRDQIIREMNARRIDHKTYINSEWLLSEYEKALDAEIDTNTMSTKTDEERATETWSLIYSGLVKDGVKFPNNFDGIGAAYGGYARLIEAFTTLRKEQEEAYTKGYNAGLADGTGKPLLAIEQIREEAVKAERERIREAFKSECQKNLKEYGGAFVSYEFEPKYLTPQNTKTYNPLES